MTRTIVKKFVAVLIAVFVVLGVVVQPVFGISLREAGDNGTLRMYNRNAGYHFGNNVPEPFAGGVSLDNGAKWAELRIVTNGQAYSAYCLQFGVGAHTGDSMVAQDYYDLPETTRRLINYMLMFGYDFSHEGDNVSKYFATQALIWQIEYGTVNTEYEQILNDDFFDSIPEAQAYYNEIKEKVYTYQVVPSFCGRTPSTTPVHEMTYNSEKRTYEAILTDTNGVLSKYFTISNTENIWFDWLSENQIRVTINNSLLDQDVEYSMNKELPGGSRACVVDY